MNPVVHYVKMFLTCFGMVFGLKNNWTKTSIAGRGIDKGEIMKILADLLTCNIKTAHVLISSAIAGNPKLPCFVSNCKRRNLLHGREIICLLEVEYANQSYSGQPPRYSTALPISRMPTKWQRRLRRFKGISFGMGKMKSHSNQAYP